MKLAHLLRVLFMLTLTYILSEVLRISMLRSWNKCHRELTQQENKVQNVW
jgi:hypothetical protein